MSERSLPYSESAPATEPVESPPTTQQPRKKTIAAQEDEGRIEWRGGAQEDEGRPASRGADRWEFLEGRAQEDDKSKPGPEVPIVSPAQPSSSPASPSLWAPSSVFLVIVGVIFAVLAFVAGSAVPTEDLDLETNEVLAMFGQAASPWLITGALFICTALIIENTKNKKS